jgi:hypothetical protein
MTEPSITDLAVLTDVERRLDAIGTVDEAKDLRDQAEAIRRYAKDRQAGLEAQNHYALIKFRCERRGGELQNAVPKMQGKRDGSEGLLLAVNRSGLSMSTAYRWMSLARLPEAELLRAAALCASDGEELTSTLVYEVLVRGWEEPRGITRPVAAPAETGDDGPEEDPPFAQRLLIERGILDPDDLLGLSNAEHATVVREVFSAYEETVEDVRVGKVTQRDGWNPFVVTDCRTFCLLVKNALEELRAGRKGRASVRRMVRVDEILKSGRHPIPAWKRPPPPPPLGQPHSLLHWLDEVDHPVRIQMR